MCWPHQQIDIAVYDIMITIMCVGGQTKIAISEPAYPQDRITTMYVAHPLEFI